MIKIAIIGFGPRGLYALECLFKQLSTKKDFTEIEVTIFDNRKELATSVVWNTKQANVNWINITERALKNLQGRKEISIKNIQILEFPSYQEWNIKNFTVKNYIDTFPPRNKVGKYLNKRAKSIVNVLEKSSLVKISNSFVTDISLDDQKFTVKDIDNNIFKFDEILLTIGHQPTKIDEDLQNLQAESLKNKQLLFEETYPIENIIQSNKIDNNKIVAIRGFGLAMIDAVRALTIGKGGEFKIINSKTLESKFITNSNVPNKIIPYSLDGLPVVPKPISETVDNIFKPSKKQLKKFKQKIKEVAKDKNDAVDSKFLKRALAKLGSEIYLNLENRNQEKTWSNKEIKSIILNWLDNLSFSHILLQDEEIETLSLLESYANMACNKKPISLDYCVGQVIRHCQPTLYKAFSHAKVSDAVFADVILFDEKMKRYSYGPPVESIQQLIALQKANIIDFNFTKGPIIKFNANGWLFEKNNNSIVINVLINSVLNPPKVLEVTSPIIKNLLRNQIIKPVHSELGIQTNKNGIIQNSETKKDINIAVLGRLAKGSVIGVDAILECFGPRINNWAKSFVKRIDS